MRSDERQKPVNVTKSHPRYALEGESRLNGARMRTPAIIADATSGSPNVGARSDIIP